ncbi:hypothetical protein [Nocardioides deserti]|uniref:Uncharacterized protein n=1 Tax=Nocardioides deserti TaxID=1588644 RepID=A0ABR6U761_9ACTN|nr:hypothetical protein [Nocardioides deserti]MBC2960267.1 hypothetical protein [Nocardioides deserti]GGO71907.1 hypothetical protein GCM10012276_14000 [Nocardioides deserti]
MRTTLALLLTPPLLAMAACGSDDAPTTAADPAATTPAAASTPRPEAVPAADGRVRTVDLATVMDTGEGAPELCLGPVAESWPPQCGGPALVDWDWGAMQGVFERSGKTRWGMFAVGGTWDGTALTVTDAVPAALYDAAVAESEPPLPAPARALSEEELAAVQADVQDLPGAQGAYVGDGRVSVDVTYDDGSLQAWADEAHGAGVVVVRSLLVDA